MSPSGGLRRFRDQINPAVLEEILTWSDHPELGKLAANLRAHLHRKAFFDIYAEAVMARHLLSRGCRLEFEVSTPLGRRCDFHVLADEADFYLHVKRVETGRPVRKKLTVSSRLRYLERIERPYVVSIRWHDDVSDAQMRHFVTAASDFIHRASVGDELTIQSAGGEEIGAVRIVAPWEGKHVTLGIDLPSGFIDEAPRIRKLMRKAYQQFMPKATNMIVMCTSHADDGEDVETALLGTHIERWDRFPPRGRRIAHGRDADGFWSARRYAESQAAGWFWVSPEVNELPCRLWLRSPGELSGELAAALQRVFRTEPEAAGP